MQEKYWKYMVQIKAWIFYLDLYVESSYKWERRINIFSALVSSTSIAAWAIWTKFAYFWAVIIAAFQVLTVVKEFLPYSKRLKTLVPFMEELKFLYNRMEGNWFEVSSGELDDAEMNKMLYEFKTHFTKMENKYFKEIILLESKKIREIADIKTDEYFKSNF